MLIDKQNTFWARPINGEAAQSESNVLDLGSAQAGGADNHYGYVTLNASVAGSAKLQHSDSASSGFTDVTGAVLTLAAAGTVTIVLPKTKRYVKGVPTTIDYTNSDFYIGAVSDKDDIGTIVVPESN